MLLSGDAGSKFVLGVFPGSVRRFEISSTPLAGSVRRREVIDPAAYPAPRRLRSSRRSRRSGRRGRYTGAFDRFARTLEERVGLGQALLSGCARWLDHVHELRSLLPAICATSAAKFPAIAFQPDSRDPLVDICWLMYGAAAGFFVASAKPFGPSEESCTSQTRSKAENWVFALLSGVCLAGFHPSSDCIAFSGAWVRRRPLASCPPRRGGRAAARRSAVSCSALWTRPSRAPTGRRSKFHLRPCRTARRSGPRRSCRAACAGSLRRSLQERVGRGEAFLRAGGAARRLDDVFDLCFAGPGDLCGVAGEVLARDRRPAGEQGALGDRGPVQVGRRRRAERFAEAPRPTGGSPRPARRAALSSLFLLCRRLCRRFPFRFRSARFLRAPRRLRLRPRPGMRRP